MRKTMQVEICNDDVTDRAEVGALPAQKMRSGCDLYIAGDDFYHSPP